MAYTVSIRLFQSKTSFNVVDILILTMNGSGTSGGLRVQDKQSGNTFIVVVGVHNYQFWSDVNTTTTDGPTLTYLHGTYYGSGERKNEAKWLGDDGKGTYTRTFGTDIVAFTASKAAGSNSDFVVELFIA
ncbi:hypothetical protein CPC08DRAFT_709052 [Agrocybe pediades]|nr:hypothetical protein CPC08DRAFT_709052 [Agrocybe pediades]